MKIASFVMAAAAVKCQPLLLVEALSVVPPAAEQALSSSVPHLNHLAPPSSSLCRYCHPRPPRRIHRLTHPKRPLLAAAALNLPPPAEALPQSVRHNLPIHPPSCKHGHFVHPPPHPPLVKRRPSGKRIHPPRMFHFRGGRRPDTPGRCSSRAPFVNISIGLVYLVVINSIDRASRKP